MNDEFSGSVCKIVPAGRFFFVASGLTYADDQQVADVGAQVGAESQSVADAMERFRQRMSVFIPRALAAESRVASAAPREPQGLVLEAAFVGMERNVASVTAEWFRVNGTVRDPRLTSDRRTYVSRNRKRFDFIFLGKRQAIDEYLEGRSIPIRGDSGAIALITQLINLEVTESPETTAPPIDILALDAFGPRWLARKASCEPAR